MSNKTNAGNPSMQPVASIAQMANGQIAFNLPVGKDLIWMLGWLETVKQSIHKMMVEQSKPGIEIPGAGLRERLLGEQRNGL